MTVKFFCPAVTVTVISFVVRGDGDGDGYGTNIGGKITHQSAFLVDTVAN